MKIRVFNTFRADPVFFTIILVTVLINTGTGIISPIIAGLLKQYGYSSFVASFPFLSLVIGRILSKAVSGKVIKFIKHKNTVIYFSIIYLIVFIGYMYFDSIIHITILRFLEGIVEGIMGIVLLDYIIEYSGSKKGEKLGLFGSAIGLGFIIGPLLGGVVSTYLGIKWTFLIGAIFGGLAALMALIYLPVFELKKQPNRKKAKAISFYSVVVNYSALYAPIYLRRVLFFSFMMILPFYLIDNFKLQLGGSSIFFMVSAIITTIGMGMTGRFADKYNPVKITIISLFAISISIFLFAFANSILAFWVFFLLEVVAFTFMVPASMKIFTQKIDSHPSRQEILGILGSMTEILTLILSFLLPFIYSVSYNYVWVFISLISLGAAFFLLLGVSQQSTTHR